MLRVAFRRPFRTAPRTVAWVAPLAGIAMLAGACATPTPEALEQARSSYQEASDDAAIRSGAPVQLHEAEQALERAERAYRDDADRDRIEHLAYIAERRVQIAQAEAERAQAEQEIRRLRQEREDIRLTARSREAQMARERATQAESRALELESRAGELETRARDFEQRLQQELAARPTERGLVITLSDVFFEVNEAELKPGAMRNLGRLVQLLRESPERQVRIEGFADATGPAEYNLELSQRRADAVRDFLTAQGIDPGRIVAEGYGERFPVASNSTAAGRQQNRRVAVVVSHEGDRVSPQPTGAPPASVSEQPPPEEQPSPVSGEPGEAPPAPLVDTPPAAPGDTGDTGDTSVTPSSDDTAEPPPAEPLEGPPR